MGHFSVEWAYGSWPHSSYNTVESLKLLKESCFCCCFFQVCDEPHPLLVKDMLIHCIHGNIDEAYKIMAHLWKLGYSPEDIITIVFRVCKNHEMPEFLKLEFIKVSTGRKGIVVTWAGELKVLVNLCLTFWNFPTSSRASTLWIDSSSGIACFIL